MWKKYLYVFINFVVAGTLHFCLLFKILLFVQKKKEGKKKKKKKNLLLSNTT
jgi:hypothetical protein